MDEAIETTQNVEKEKVIDLNTFLTTGQKLLIQGVMASNALPSEEKYKFYNVHNSFKKTMTIESERLLLLMKKILNSQKLNYKLSSLDLNQQIETVIEANDNILENVAIELDKMGGRLRKEPLTLPAEMQTVTATLPVNGSWNRIADVTVSEPSPFEAVTSKALDPANSIRLLAAKNIIKPQVNFEDQVDNRNIPWIPRIKEKPNSLKPLALLPETTDFGDIFPHPYEYELERFTPSAESLKKVTPIIPNSFEKTPFYEITTEEDLKMLLNKLQKQSEFAVDLEHHSYRTFLGITCLMQISTREEDYIIDTLVLRNKLEILNEVFTKPSIVKVFHGAENDIQWLQRDLSLYVVNMFDTHQAAKQMEFSGLSLAHLLKKYCDVTPNKYFQLADWRIRPLPEELKLYARMDTHYLLYIYDSLKNELLNASSGKDNLLNAVINESTQICMQVYEKPLLNNESHLYVYEKSRKMFDNRQMYAFKNLYKWRDTVAREEDDSVGYVLPNHMLLRIAETLPREMQGILSCCNPIPPPVQTLLIEMHRIILEAREQPLVKPILKEDNRNPGNFIQSSKYDSDNPLYCIHELPRSSRLTDNLPTLMDSQLKINLDVLKSTSDLKVETLKSKLSVFDDSDVIDNEESNGSNLVIRGVTFLSPYQRYLRMKEYVASEEKEPQINLHEKSETNEISQEVLVSSNVEICEPSVTNEVINDTQKRIENIYAHISKVSQEIPQIPRESGIQNVEENVLSFHSSYKAGKRKHNDIDSDEEFKGDQTTLVQMGGSKKKRFLNKKFNFQNTQNSKSAGPSSVNNPTKRNNKPKNKPKNKLKKRNQQHFGENQFGNDHLQNNQNDYRNFQNTSQNSYQFQSFDYSAVNFNEFQGGSGSCKQEGIQARFKPKGKNKQNKKYNKNTTYRRK